MSENKLKERLKNEPEIMDDVKDMMALLLECLPKSELKIIALYYSCVEKGIVREMLEMEYYNNSDVEYFNKMLMSDDLPLISKIKTRTVIRNWLELLGVEECDYETGLRLSILQSKLEDMDLNPNIKKFFYENDYDTLEDLLTLELKDLLMYQKRYDFNSEEILNKINLIIRDDIERKGEVFTEENHPGKKICNSLRNIRRKIAEANDIPFETTDCHNTEPCRGTCPVCDSELEYLNKKIEEKVLNGEEVNLLGLGEDEIQFSGCDIDPLMRHMTRGMPLFLNDDEEFVYDDEENEYDEDSSYRK